MELARNFGSRKEAKKTLFTKIIGSKLKLFIQHTAELKWIGAVKIGSVV